MRRERLGLEGRYVVARSEREMHLRRAPSQEIGFGEIAGDELLRDVGGRFVSERHQWIGRRRFGESLDRAFVADDALKETIDDVERVTPGVARVWGVTLQDRDRGRLGAVVGILDRAGKGRGVAERSLFVQKSSDLEIGVDPRLDFSKQLQEKSLSIDDGGIALLRLQRLRMQLAAVAKLTKRTRRRSAEQTAAALQACAAADDVEQCVAEFFVGNRLVQQTTVLQTRDQGGGALGLVGASRLRDRERQKITIGFAFGVFHLQDHQRSGIASDRYCLCDPQRMDVLRLRSEPAS